MHVLGDQPIEPRGLEQQRPQRDRDVQRSDGDPHAAIGPDELDVMQGQRAEEAAVERGDASPGEAVLERGLDAAPQLLAAPPGMRGDERDREHHHRHHEHADREPPQPAQQAAHQKVSPMPSRRATPWSGSSSTPLRLSR